MYSCIYPCICNSCGNAYKVVNPILLSESVHTRAIYYSLNRSTSLQAMFQAGVAAASLAALLRSHGWRRRRAIQDSYSCS